MVTVSLIFDIKYSLLWAFYRHSLTKLGHAWSRLMPWGVHELSSLDGYTLFALELMLPRSVEANWGYGITVAATWFITEWAIPNVTGRNEDLKVSHWCAVKCGLCLELIDHQQHPLVGSDLHSSSHALTFPEKIGVILERDIIMGCHGARWEKRGGEGERRKGKQKKTEKIRRWCWRSPLAQRAWQTAWLWLKCCNSFMFFQWVLWGQLLSGVANRWRCIVGFFWERERQRDREKGRERERYADRHDKESGWHKSFLKLLIH